MNNVSTPDGRGQESPHDAQPFFPSEGSFNPVVPLSEVDHAPAQLPTVDADDVGRPAEADWAREAHRASWKEDEETLVPARTRETRVARPSWLVTAAVIIISVSAGLASGTYLIWSSQRAPESQTPAPVAAEAPALPPAPAPVAEQAGADKNVEKAAEPARPEKPSEVAKAEKSDAVSRASEPEPPARTASAPRAERVARAAAEPKEAAPAPKPARTQNAAPARTRPTTAARQTHAPAASARSLPVSAPPPSAKPRKVIQWP
ncbi:MAG TPA: hypothetical protein VF591_21470 [Pyrinomonadaceae bacterium]|jgi:type IV secretory pathway VirB10-like protein